MKRLPSMSLVVALSAGVAACDSDPGAKVTQRDVYTGPNAFENCVADWGNEELCRQQIDAEDAKKLAQANQSGGGGGAAPSIIFLPGGGGGFYGPSYDPGTRSAVHNGRIYSPSYNRSAQTSAFAPSAPGAKPTLTGWAKPGATFPKTVNVSSRGGFGAAGRGSGGGS